MHALEDLLRKFQSLNQDDILSEVLDKPSVKQKIIDLNQEQLFVYGEDSYGHSLGRYSPYTIRKKQEKGQPYDHVTLFDTGRMYDSEKVYVDHEGGVEMEMDTVKDGVDLQYIYGTGIVGLNEHNLNIIIEDAKEDIITEVENWIGK